MRKLKTTTRQLATSIISAPRKPQDADADTLNMMLDSRYLRQSSALIQDALQKGFDVLQLTNGEIITTGTKTIVHKYIWDDAKGKLVKSKSEVSENADETEDNSVSC